MYLYEIYCELVCMVLLLFMVRSVSLYNNSKGLIERKKKKKVGVLVVTQGSIIFPDPDPGPRFND